MSDRTNPQQLTDAVLGPDGIAVITRLQQAITAHDLDAMSACFAADFRSEFPAHPDRAFRGREQMWRNWSQIFAGVSDLRSELVRSAANENTVWAEWEWRGTRAGGLPYAMRGTTIQGIENGRIAWVRLYMEPIQVKGPGTEEALRESLR